MKKTLCLMVAVCVGAWSLDAAAQDISATKRKRSVSADARKEAQERQEALTKRLDKDKTKDPANVPTGPTNEDNILDSPDTKKMTLEQIDNLRQQIAEKNIELIRQFEELISADPYSPDKPDWMFEMAELKWELRNYEYLRERAEYNKCLDAVDKGNIDESKCAEPKPNYVDAQKIYDEILKQYPAYVRLDEVIFRLGSGLIRAGKGAQAVPLLNRLVANYPDSRYLPETHLALGEFYFEKNLFGAAKDNYESVLKYEDFSFYDYGLYKLGWTFYNQQEFRTSINTFKKVVERNNETLGFQKQAINDLIVAFAAVDDGWKEARAYFLEQRDVEFAYKKMAQMAGYLEGQGNDEDAVKIFEWFIEERPNNQKIPDWMESIVIAKKKEVSNLEGTEDAMVRFVAYLDKDGTWWAKNKDNKQATNNADLLVESSLAYLSNVYHTRAQKMEEGGNLQDALGDYKKASGFYEQFIKRFPNKAASFDMNFFLGEIYMYSLSKSKDEAESVKYLQMAANQYQKVVDLYKDDNIPKSVKKKDAEAIVKDSAYASVQVWNEMVLKFHRGDEEKNIPESILVTMKDAAESSKGGVYKKDESLRITDGKQGEAVYMKPTPLFKYEEPFVKASDQWSEMYPKEDVTPTIDYVSAEVYKSHFIYDRAIPRYENIITNAPKHKYASFSGASLLEANYQLKRWAEVEKWARHMISIKNFQVVSKKGLRETIAFAINSKAADLDKEGKPLVAAGELLRLADEFPENEKLAPGAVFNAAAYFERANQIKKAVDTYERLVGTYPDSEKAPEALFTMGLIYEARADFSKAASYFERLGVDRYKDADQARDALINSAELYRAMEEWDKIIGVYEKFMDVYGKDSDEETAKSIHYMRIEMARLEMKAGRPKEAIARYQKLLKRKDLRPDEKIEANIQIGMLLEEAKGKRWENESTEYYERGFRVWAKDSASITADAKDPVTDALLQQRAREFTSHAKFLLAERIFEDYKKVRLSFPIGKFRRLAQEKGELEQAAEKLYFEAIDIAKSDKVNLAAPMWIAASAYRIGQMYQDFSNAIYELPMPEGLTEDQEFEYQAAIDDLAFPLQEKALKAFQRARSLAVQYKTYNEWSAKSSAEISKLEAEAYPITSQEGVEVGYDTTQYTRTGLVIDLEDTKGRMMAAQKARLEETERKRKEAEVKAAAAAAAEGE